MKGLNAGCDNDFSDRQTCRNHDRSGIETLYLHVVERHGLGRRVDDPDGGLAFDLGERTGRNRDAWDGVQFQASVTVAPSRIASG